MSLSNGGMDIAAPKDPPVVSSAYIYIYILLCSTTWHGAVAIVIVFRVRARGILYDAHTMRKKKEKKERGTKKEKMEESAQQKKTVVRERENTQWVEKNHP